MKAFGYYAAAKLLGEFCYEGFASVSSFEKDTISMPAFAPIGNRVVWSFIDFERFGDSLTNSQILAADGAAIPLDGPEFLR